MCGILAYLKFLPPISARKSSTFSSRDSSAWNTEDAIPPAWSSTAATSRTVPTTTYAYVQRRAENVSVLADGVKDMAEDVDLDAVYNIHCGIAHTRCTTHCSPKDVNSHPHRSNETNDFVVVHNGTIANYCEIKEYLLKKGHKFESETDTEIIAKLAQDIYELLGLLLPPARRNRRPAAGRRLRLAFKSRKLPGQVVVTRRGSTLLVGIKSDSRFSTKKRFNSTKPQEDDDLAPRTSTSSCNRS